MAELKKMTTGMASGGILPDLAGDARRDYVQLLLGNTYSLDNQAAINNANNLAFRDTEFTDDWAKKGAGSSRVKLFVDLAKQYMDIFTARQNEQTKAAAARRDILLEKINGLKEEKRVRLFARLDADIQTVWGKSNEIEKTLANRFWTDATSKKLQDEKNKLDAWLLEAQKARDKFVDGSLSTEQEQWAYECRVFKGIFNKDIVINDYSMNPAHSANMAELADMQEYWKKNFAISDPINKWFGKCEDAMKKYHDKIKSTVTDFLKTHNVEKLLTEVTTSLKNLPSVRKSTSNDDYGPKDSVFDIMIRNNENLIMALIGKHDGSATDNLLKTVKESLDENANSIGNKLDTVKAELKGFVRKLSDKFTKIRTWANTKVGAHTHTVPPAGKSHQDMIFIMGLS